MDVKINRSFIRKEQKSMLIICGVLFFGFYATFMFFPMIYSILGSFHEWNPTNGKFNAVGFENYQWILKDKYFWATVGRTFYFTAATVILRTGFGLLIAVMINSVKRFKGFFRTSIFLPVICSMVAVSLVWKWLYEPSTGLFNYVLSVFGASPLGWLKDQKTALLCIIITTVWKDLGYSMVIFLAGINGIPSMYYESAEIDGANCLNKFFKITLPLLKPTTAFILTTSIIAYLQAFTQIFAMTEKNTGGPGTTCHTTVFMLYQKAFIQYDFGVASAVSCVLFLIILAVSILQLRLMKDDGRG